MFQNAFPRRIPVDQTSIQTFANVLLHNTKKFEQHTNTDTESAARERDQRSWVVISRFAGAGGWTDRERSVGWAADTSILNLECRSLTHSNISNTGTRETFARFSPRETTPLSSRKMQLHQTSLTVSPFHAHKGTTPDSKNGCLFHGPLFE